MPGVGTQFDFDRFPEAQRGGLRVYPYGGITSGCTVTAATVATNQTSINVQVAAGSCVLDGRAYSVAAAGSGAPVNVTFVPKDDSIFSYQGRIYRGYKNTFNNRSSVFTELPSGVTPVVLRGPVVRARREVPAVTQAQYDTAVAGSGLKALYESVTGAACVGIAQSGDYHRTAKFVVVSPVQMGEIAGYLDSSNGHQEVIGFIRCTDATGSRGTWEWYNPIYDEPPSLDYLNLPLNGIIGAELAANDEVQIWNKVSSTVMHARFGAARMREPAGILLGQFLLFYVSNRASADFGKFCTRTGTVLTAATSVLPDYRQFTHAYNTPAGNPGPTVTPAPAPSPSPTP